MAPPPRRNQPQSQPLTTALANILRDYHAGGTVLRELLQNADDAGASRMDFHLSTKPVPTSNLDLLHESLHDYQGPSLIAHNSSPPFSQTDFESLTHIGDSEKAKDPAKTGKFGIGFNAVYHWTDSPQILSDQTLLILDPHHGWSASAEIGCPGGPSWDVVKDGKDEAMANQLSVFRSVLGVDLEGGLDGTAVRLPLRTEKQAESSRICQKSVGVEEMIKVLEDFSSGFAGGGYGVFLKAVEEVTVNVDGECIGAWRVVNREEVREKRIALIAAFNRIFITAIQNSIALTFDMEVEAALPGTEGNKKATWAIQHLMQQNLGGAQDLVTWGRKGKLFGWVAVAAPIDGFPLGDFSGELFTILSLNKPINGQPVHIHGLFSISSDRASLHFSAEKASQDPNPFLWNQRLFDRLVPEAWARMLGHICTMALTKRIGWEYWPKASGMILDQLGQSICGGVLEYVWSKKLSVFPSGVGYVDQASGLFTMAEEVNEELQVALTCIGIPVVYIESTRRWIYEGLRAHGGRKLEPVNVCEFLKENHADRLRYATPSMKKVLLEYLIVSSLNGTTEGTNTCVGKDGVDFEMLYGIPLFPLEDGTYQALYENRPGIYVSRYDGEESTFELEPARNLDHSLASKATLESLRRVADMGDLPICYRSQEDFLRYAKEYIFADASENQHVIGSSPGTLKFVDLAWPWIHSESKSGRRFRYDDFSSLWLIPISGNYLSKFEPDDPLILRSLGGETGRLLRQLFVLDFGRPGWVPPLLELEGLSEETAKILNETWTHGLGSCETLGNLLTFLVEAKGCLETAGDELKRSILENIASKFESGTNEDRCTAGELLPELPVFEQVWTEFVGGKMEHRRRWVEKSGSAVFIGTGGLPLIPPGQRNILFISSDVEDVRHMFTDLGLASWPSKAKLLERHVIPALAEKGGCDLIPGDSRIEILHMVLRNYFKFSKETKSLISGLAIMPFQQTPDSPSNTPNGVDSPPPSFLPISSLLNPTSVDIHGLYFSDESLFPWRDLFDVFSGVMIQCGLRSKLTQNLAFGRVQEFAKSSRLAAEVVPRAKQLLQTPLVGCLPVSWIGEINGLAWIPVKGDTASREMVKVAPTECRSLRYRLLVSYLKHVLDYGVDKTWNELFKWESTLDKGILIRQLEQGSHAEDRTSCVVGASGKLFRADEVFLQDAKALSPYFDEVDLSFQRKHPTLIHELNVKQKPSLDNLFEVQQHLVESEQPLDKRNTAIAVELARLASFHDRGLLEKLVIPSRKCELRSIADLAFWDMEYSASREATSLAHESISEEISTRLGIQMYSEKMSMDAMGLQGQDDDEEYSQMEKTSTRIRDTLLRYQVDATFGEYPANAEDTDKAKCVDWLLDGCPGYPSRTLLSKDLAPFQGQALFVHNDALFLEEDFVGFKNVGEGSKRDEEFAIGQFGRGAQTMFHWTDVPMLVSGEFFLILDPQQRFLPVNRKYGQRYPGLKVKLAQIRQTCPDQLAPFQGLWGYSTNLDSYDGTIFRFPFRPQNLKSDLAESTEHISYNEAKKLLDKYFETARLSLLFLRQIERISFSIRQEKRSRWKVWKPDHDNRRRPVSQHLKIRSKNVDKQSAVDAEENWLVHRREIEEIPKRHQEWFSRMKKRAKHSHCGVAALLSPQGTSSPNRIFHTLPSKTLLDLPVHIHGTFVLSGDRQNVQVDPSASRSDSMWNRWLLQDCLPTLYLDLLDELVRDPRADDVFKLWHLREPSKQEHSDLIREAFWEKVATSTNRLYPRAKRATTLKKKLGRHGGEREAEELVKAFDIRDAKFDFLSGDYSADVQDLLRTWFPTLVRIPAGRIQKALKKLEAGNKLTVDDILDKIRNSSDLHEPLEKFARETPAAFDELGEIVLRTANKENLHGCPILPLQNGSLGTLCLLNSLQTAPTYFVATRKDQELFDFASDLFVKDQYSVETATRDKSSIGKKFLDALLISKSTFNVKCLTAQDVGQVLAKRCAEEWEPALKLGDWLSKFWPYFQALAVPLGSETEENILEMCGIDNFPVYQATTHGKTVFVRPADLNSLPTIIRPTVRERLNLCHRFPDLVLLDPARMLSSPKMHLRSNFDILSRFLNALGDIARTQEKPLETFISTALDKGENEIEDIECRNTFRDIVMNVATELASTRAPSRQALLSTMRVLPIVPTAACFGPPSYITIEKALATNEPKLLVPWLKDRNRFMNPMFLKLYEQKLKVLGLKPLSHKKMFFEYVFPTLPATLAASGYPGAYTELIKTISNENNFSFDLSHTRLAANTDGIMCYPRDLLNHKDSVYSEAFDRATSPRFLYHDVRMYGKFWSRHGLRGGGQKKISRCDYLECLRSLENQIRAGGSTLDFLEKIENVLSGLRRVEDVGRNNSEFREILSVNIIPTEGRIRHEPTFRRTTMQDLHNGQPVVSCWDIIYDKHRPCCWTQVPFPVQGLSLPVDVLGQLRLNGSPRVSLVWDHLRSLVQVSEGLRDGEVEDFLSDLCKTYEYLQDNATDLSTLPALDQERIWLNLKLKEYDQIRPGAIVPLAREVRDAWMDISHLLLRAPYDPGEMQSVRPFLMVYEKLLKLCGCQPVRTPTLPKPEPNTSTSRPTLNEIASLWEDQKLTDVVFSAEGKTIGAHKLVLTAVSEMWKTKYLGKWAALDGEGLINLDQDSINYQTLDMLLKFAYYDDIDWASMSIKGDTDDSEAIADKLDMLLDLLRAANQWRMVRLHDAVERFVLERAWDFIRIDNVRRIEEEAEFVHAKRLMEACRLYCENNAEVMTVVDREAEEVRDEGEDGMGGRES